MASHVPCLYLHSRCLWFACSLSDLCAAILLQPLITLYNWQASSALLNLRQLNTYPGNNVPAWLKPPANSCFSGILRPQSSCVSQDSGSAVLEIVRGLRLKAHIMVDAAVQVFAFSLLALLTLSCLHTDLKCVYRNSECNHFLILLLLMKVVLWSLNHDHPFNLENKILWFSYIISI